jgi:cytoskeletal protein CcmA (bactofilin family)
MFKKSRDAQQVEARASTREQNRDGALESGGKQATVLAHGSALEGTIRTRGPLHVDGAVCGSLTCEGQMSVGATGLIMGEVHVQSLSANGRVSGLVFVRHHLKVREQGRLIGHARYETLEIVRGGVLDGSTCRVSGVPTLVDASDEDEYEAAQ